jgi:HmuY protein
MKKTILASAVLFSAAIFTLSSCNKDDSPQPVTTVEKIDSLKVSFSPVGAYTFFNFKNGSVVANTDSASTKWDFGLRFTTFILNSNTYGPGNAAAILQNSIYSTVTAAPESGYAYDTTASKKAIKDGSWYNYNSAARTFSPKSGQTFIFRTAENNYVKMELLAVDYEPFVGQAPTRLIYKFRYTYQANGTKNF